MFGLRVEVDVDVLWIALVLFLNCLSSPPNARLVLFFRCTYLVSVFLWDSCVYTKKRKNCVSFVSRSFVTVFFLDFFSPLFYISLSLCLYISLSLSHRLLS